MIVGCALTPHTPLLLPTIGKDATESLQKTREGMARLKSTFAETDASTVVLIKTPERGRKRRSVFEIQLPQRVTADFSEFGDLLTHAEFSCDTVLGLELKNNMRRSGLSLTYSSNEKLEYTASVPLITLFDGQPIKTIVIQPPDADPEILFQFGKALTASLQESQKRIVCIAAGDCAHCVHKGKKQAYEHVCLPFDYMFIDAVQKKTPDSLLAIKREEVIKLNACAVPPATVLRGIIDSLAWNARLLSYEAPFGVGYAVLEYSI